MLISGVSVSDTQLIPPQQQLYRNVGICGPSCTSTVMTPVFFSLSLSSLRFRVGIDIVIRQIVLLYQ